MPTLKLFDSTAAPDGWHNVGAPGGYEWWYFDAEDVAADRQIVAILFQGFVFHPGYLRADARYRRRPTRVPPAVAKDYPCAYFVVYEKGKIAHQFMTQYRPEQFAARSDRAEVTIGPNTLKTTGRSIDLKLSGTPWALTWQGPKRATGEALTADFTFVPSFDHSAQEREFLSREMTGADHHWVIAAPRCEVKGTIHPPDGAPIEFTGVGYHDHNYGTGPLGPGLARWAWGRAIFDDHVLAFHVAVPADSSLPIERHVVAADAKSFGSLPVVPHVDWTHRSVLGLRYPSIVRFENVLTLSQPRLIDSSPFYLRLQYEAHAGPHRGRAFCEVAHPNRLRWPVLGRMIEMSIDKTALALHSLVPK